ncbi:MAG: translation elongation factor Ts [Gammaproteobacteria bacterium]
MEISAAAVKDLRERTGAGMMECKKALLQTQGDAEQAIDLLRKSGAAKAAKRSGRTATEGLIAVGSDAEMQAIAMVEVNSETDFVARNEKFRAFAQSVADCVLGRRPKDLEALLSAPLGEDGGSVDAVRLQLSAEIGENLSVRRFVRVTADGARLGLYRHGSKIGVVTVLTGGDAALAKDIAMHVAATRPVCIHKDQVPAELVARERAIYEAQAAETGKPPEVVRKIAAGKLDKFINEVTLLGQPFVKDQDTTIAKLLSAKGADILRFERLEVGEGMAQVRGG